MLVFHLVFDWERQILNPAKVKISRYLALFWQKISKILQKKFFFDSRRYPFAVRVLFLFLYMWSVKVKIFKDHTCERSKICIKVKSEFDCGVFNFIKKILHNFANLKNNFGYKMRMTIIAEYYSLICSKNHVHR